MFEIGDTVMYGSSGVCKIADIRREKFGPEERTYYVIHPLHDTNSTIYAPIMKEAESILHSEFAHVLQIRPDEVVPFIMGELQAKKHSIAHD